jgi:ribose transport system substrate-binding protein
MPADDPNFNASGGAFGSEAAAEEQAATDATGAVEAALAAPTSIGVDAPLASAPAAGSLIVSLSDGTAWNTLLNASMAEAAAAIGWEFQEVAGAETVESVPAAFDEALALEPAGIRISGEHVEALATQLAAAEAAGVPVICTGCSGEPTGAIKDTSIDGDAQNAEWGKVLAEYVFTNQS